MDPAAAYPDGLVEFDRRVRAVRPDQWTGPTPCREWDVRQLVNHVVVEQLWAPLLLAGETIAGVGGRFDGDQVGADPVTTWTAAADGARAAFGRSGALDATVDLSYGPTPAHYYCAEMLTDLVVHAWDLARAVGADERLDPGLVRFAYDFGAGHADELSASGYFADAVPVGAGAGEQQTMLALFGRPA